MTLALLVIAYVVGAYFVVRAVVELAMIKTARPGATATIRSKSPGRPDRIVAWALDREIPDDPMPRKFRRTTDDDEQPRGSGLPNVATRILDATAGAVRGRQRRTRTSPNPCQMGYQGASRRSGCCVPIRTTVSFTTGSAPSCPAHVGVVDSSGWVNLALLARCHAVERYRADVARSLT
jgi:hypothetical protein